LKSGEYVLLLLLAALVLATFTRYGVLPALPAATTTTTVQLPGVVVTTTVYVPIPGEGIALTRSWGTALASYVRGPQGTTYLRLTMTDGNSGVESALTTMSFNASRTGASVEWAAVANRVAADDNHTFYPMVLENSPNGTEGMGFKWERGTEFAFISSNGVAVRHQVYWDPTTVHRFKIVVVKPGFRVDFYVDGTLVAYFIGAVPRSTFLLEAGELYSTVQLPRGIATLDVYGGVLG
jgi:hypothetical protein